MRRSICPQHKTLRASIGPLQPFNATSRFCGAARRTGHSLRLRNLGEMNSQSADKDEAARAAMALVAGGLR
jgi:hypothetical protein